MTICGIFWCNDNFSMITIHSLEPVYGETIIDLHVRHFNTLFCSQATPVLKWSAPVCLFEQF